MNKTITAFADTETVFYCSVDVDVPIRWSTDLAIVRTNNVSTDSHVLFTLTVLARAEYNGTTIKCESEHEASWAINIIFTLFIQGTHAHNYYNKTYI